MAGMSIPGLNLTAAPPPSASVPATRIFALTPNQEYRFEVSTTSTLTVKLTDGLAELFGTELARNTREPYVFLPGTKAAIYTWHGCKIEVTGTCDVEYVADETTASVALNVHFALEESRKKAEQELQMHKMRGIGISETGIGTVGPRVLVLGPQDSGKTSLVKTITAYGVKMGRQPVVVNLDPRQGMLNIPGAFTAAVFASMMDVQEGFGSSPISGPSPVPVKMPLVYHFGLPVPDEGGKVFKPLVTRMALAVTSRMEQDEDVRVSGCIIDTPGQLSSGRAGAYENIQHIISEFSVNTILVLGSDRLYNDMIRRFPSPGTNTPRPSVEDVVTVTKLPSFEGAVDRDESYMKFLRHQQVRTYFMGYGQPTLHPHAHWEDFSDLHVLKLIDPANSPLAANQTQSSFLPGLGALGNMDYLSSLSQPTTLYEKVVPSMLLQNRLLAVTRAAPTDSHDKIRDSAVMGYVYVADVDEGKRKVRLLAPVSGRVPSMALVLSSWPEDIAGLVG